MTRGAVMDSQVNLIAMLRRCAEQWCTDCEASPARLGRTVVNDGGYFDRISIEGASTTTATLEKFAAFLGDSAHWPSGAVPPQVCEFVRRVEGRVPEACAGLSHASVNTTSGQRDHG